MPLLQFSDLAVKIFFYYPNWPKTVKEKCVFSKTVCKYVVPAVNIAYGVESKRDEKTEEVMGIAHRQ